MTGTRSEALRVGFIGLGLMGRPMAVNVARAGFPLTVHSRSAASTAAFTAELGAVGETFVALDPAAVTEISDVTILMVPDTADLEAMVDEPRGLLVGLEARTTALATARATIDAGEGTGPRPIVIDMGTHDPTAMPGIAARLAAKGVDFLDAPVSGGVGGARAGDLAIMVGGEASVLERARPVLEAMGERVVYIGPVGAGMVAKACNQLVVGSTIEAVAEALALARAAGVDPARVREAMLGGFAASRVLEVHGRRMLEADFAPGGRVVTHAKDARIIRAVAAATGVPIPGFEPVAEAFARLVAEGHGELDHAALITLLEDRPPA